jgi:hypothetical protein
MSSGGAVTVRGLISICAGARSGTQLQGPRG